MPFIPQTKLAMKGSNGFAKGYETIARGRPFILIRKNRYLVTLAVVSPKRNTRSRAQTLLFNMKMKRFPFRAPSGLLLAPRRALVEGG